jgi:hypothetical protein
VLSRDSRPKALEIWLLSLWVGVGNGRASFEGTQLLKTSAAVSGITARRSAQVASTIVTICTRRKKAEAAREATAVSLPVGKQMKVGAAWLKRLEALPASAPANEIYSGRAFAIARQAAEAINGRLYVASAGLGLVPGSRKIPAYGLTVSRSDPDSVAHRISDELDASDWFEAMLMGPYSDSWSKLAGAGSGRILLALTNSYAAMIGPSLAALPATMRTRLRFFGPSLAEALPSSLAPNICPCDSRIDTIMPGTKSDLPQRCMLHFVRVIGDRLGGCESDFTKFKASFKGIKRPARPVRPRQTDQQILKLINVHLKSGAGMVRTLRAIRHDHGVACEQARFTRLYRLASAGATA